MSTDIFVYYDREKREPTVVCGGTPSMGGLVYPVGDIVREKYPQIYEVAFRSAFGWGEARLGDLDGPEFRIVYDLTMAEYRKFLEEHPTETYRPGDHAAYDNWLEYVAALHADPRMDPKNDADHVRIPVDPADYAKLIEAFLAGDLSFEQFNIGFHDQLCSEKCLFPEEARPLLEMLHQCTIPQYRWGEGFERDKLGAADTPELRDRLGKVLRGFRDLADSGSNRAASC